MSAFNSPPGGTLAGTDYVDADLFTAWDASQGKRVTTPRSQMRQAVGISEAVDDALTAATLPGARDALGVPPLICPLAPDYGAAGDGDGAGGGTDDAAAVLAALNAASGAVLEGANRTYRCDSALAPTCENVVIQNLTLDFTNVSGSGNLLGFAGSQGTATLLGANASAGDVQLTVADSSGFAVEQYAWLYSDAVWDNVTSTTLGQIVKIKSIDDATHVTVYDDILYAFATADSAALAPLTVKENITLRNVGVIGAGANTQAGIYFDKCADVTVDDCDLVDCDYIGVGLSRCVNASVAQNAIRYARGSGTSYGIAVYNGCYGVDILGNYGEDTRHLVTVGDNDGVNLFVNVQGNHGAGCKDAGIDAHAACDHMTIDGNTVEGAATDSGQHDGIIFQGANVVISDNTIVGFRDNGIFCQHYSDIAVGSATITGNKLRNGAGSGTDVAIYVLTQGDGTLDGVVIADNAIGGSAYETHIQVYALTASISNVSVTGNTASNAAGNQSLLIRATANFDVTHVVVANNVLRSSASEVVYLLGVEADNIKHVAIANNIVVGGTYSIRLAWAFDVTAENNHLTGYGTRQYLVDANSTGVRFDRRYSGIVTATNSTYAVTDDDEFLIFNRAGTITATLPSAAAWPGRRLKGKTIQAQQVDSAASNVVPLTSATAGTAILPATDGAWGEFVSDGSNWIQVAGSSV